MYAALEIFGFFTFCWVGLGVFIYGFLQHAKQE
jgi:hypothetical protein